MFNAPRCLFALLAVWQLQYNSVVADDAPVDLCGPQDSWNSTNPAQPYFFVPNAWGDDGSGGSCLNVTNDAAAWTLEYKWTGTPTLVKQYAEMKSWPSNLPTRLQNVSHLELKMTFSTVVDGTQDQDPAQQALALHLNSIWSNVAVDMFLSTDPANSTSDNPPIEVMIWPYYSIWVRPLGWQETDPNQHVVMVDNMNFSLYAGYNAGNQHVFSWLAHQNMTSMNADYSPLLKYLWQNGMIAGDLWLGQLAVGTEVLHAGATTIFSASDYDIQLIRQGDADDFTSTSTTSSMSATPTSTASSTAPASTSASATPSTTSKSAGSSWRLNRTLSRNVLLGLMTFTIFTHIA